jgi:nucleoside-diphosphate-sugar epimerase
MAKKILVTGDKGGLGKRLVPRLIQEGYEVEGFDILDGKDIRRKTQVEKAVKKCDIVLHLAAVADLNYAREHPKETMEVNILGLINILEACRKFKKDLIFASTCCCYGNTEQHPEDENTFPKPTEIYAHSKLAGEHLILGYAKHFGIRYNILRLATFIGPEMRPAMAAYIFIERAMKGEPIEIHGDGKQTRTFTYIDDVVDGIIAVLKSGVWNEIINITTEEETSVLKMAEIAMKVTGRQVPIKFIPDRPGQIRREQILAQKALKLCGWKAKTSFEEAMRLSYEWIKEKNNPAKIE